MSEVSAPNKLPSEQRLKTLRLLGLIAYIAGLALAATGTVMFVGAATYDYWVLLAFVACILIVGGISAIVSFGRRRDKYYTQVMSGIITSVDWERANSGDYTFINVKGKNRAGEEITQRVYLNPDKWRKMEAGQTYHKP